MRATLAFNGLIEAKFGDDPLAGSNYTLFIFGPVTCVMTKSALQNFEGNRNRNKRSSILRGFQSIGSSVVKTKYDRAEPEVVKSMEVLHYPIAGVMTTILKKPTYT